MNPGPFKQKKTFSKKLKLIGKHAVMNTEKFSKFCFLAAKIKMVSYSELENKFSPLLIKFLLN